MSFRSHLLNLQQSIPRGITIVAVSKTKTTAAMLEAYACGIRHFGENRVQELGTKVNHLPSDVVWHFIGHLQTNKVKYIAPFIHTIHSLDSIRLMDEINREAIRHRRVIECLLELRIASEESKFGLDAASSAELVKVYKEGSYPGIKICGVMGMASFTDDKSLIRSEFRTLHDHFNEIRNRWFQDSPEFKEISMGMSGDYPIAIEEGSTMLRLGTIIFGDRQ